MLHAIYGTLLKKDAESCQTERYWKSLPAASGCLPLYQLQVGAVWPKSGGIWTDPWHRALLACLWSGCFLRRKRSNHGKFNQQREYEKCGGFDQEVHTSRTWPGTYRTGFSSWNEQQDNLLETQIFPRPSLAVCHLSNAQAAGVDMCPRARPMLASLYLSRRMPVVRLSSLQSCLTADR